MNPKTRIKGTITEKDVFLVRQFFGDDIANALADAAEGSNFLDILAAQLFKRPAQQDISDSSP